jgi:hypothetical protein
MASDSGADAAALRERVKQLEETVADQHHSSESPDQPTASRRGFVKAAAAVAGLGALGIYSSYPASAQAAGQIGSASSPVDAELYDLNVQNSATLGGDLDGGGNDLTNINAIDVSSVSAASPSIDLTANDAQTVTVPGDFADPQTAVDSLQPLYGRYQIDIEVTQDFPNTDLYIEPMLSRRIAEGQTGEIPGPFRIIGDTGYPELNSVFVDSVQGMGMSVERFTLTGPNPHSDEDASAEAYGCPGRVLFNDLVLTGTNTAGVISYSSNVTVGTGLDCTGASLTQHVVTKHNGRMKVNGDITGSAGDNVAQASGGKILFNDAVLPVTATAGAKKFSSEGGGIVRGDYVAGPAGPDLSRRVTQSVVGNAIDLTAQYISVSGGGTLETINADPPEGTQLHIRGDSGSTLTVKHNVDNILLAGKADRTLDDRFDQLRLIYDPGGFWVEVAFADNN